MEIGKKEEVLYTVQDEDLAKSLSIGADDDFPEVYATSKMVLLMETAAGRLMKPLLKEGELSVGVGVDIKHFAPTPTKAGVRAIATYLGQEKKNLNSLLRCLTKEEKLV